MSLKNNFCLVIFSLFVVINYSQNLMAESAKISKDELSKFESMSPFEFKGALRSVAKEAFGPQQSDLKILNAGRGNPNFLNTTVREAFCYLNLVATRLADEAIGIDDLGRRPNKQGIAEKLKVYLEVYHKDSKAAELLIHALDYVNENFGVSQDDFAYELVHTSLGDYYPSPSRFFTNIEKVVNKYLLEIMLSSSDAVHGKFDLFATEGGTGAMVYIFDSLKNNKILNAGDTVAILTPIFSPYLEIPELKEYDLKTVFIEGEENNGWNIAQSEIDKLKDKNIKALYLVNPTNPNSISLNSQTLDRIESLVKSERDDLIVLTDTVYATFVDNFRSLVEVLPFNTLCVYSYSKFFGVTGWRLGVIMLHENNVVDKLISNLSEADKVDLDKRYKIASMDPRAIKFIDRLEIDSRKVALAHTGGISAPQQCIMGLFSLYYLLDKDLKYKKSVLDKLRKRALYLYRSLEIDNCLDEHHANYYALIDIAKTAKEKYGEVFADYLINNYSMTEFLFRLAKEKFTICLPGEGFAGPKWSLRVSLANLNDEEYLLVGRNIKEVLDEYYNEYNSKL